jgi:3-oxoacyl-[acyl-carrier protein] reductase
LNLNLSGKTAIVTGSSRGIGKSIAKTLIAEGCNVVINGRKNSDLKKAQNEIGKDVKTFAGDISDSKICKSLVKFTVKTFGKLDFLVCNVGSGKSVPIGEETSQEWNRMLSLNLSSVTNMIRPSIPYLEKSNGAIVCISSITGIEYLGAPVAYAASKAALNNFVKSYSRFLGGKGIRINAVAPGNILFDGSVWHTKLKKNPKQIRQFIKNEVSLSRLGKPEEIANLVVILGSEISSFVTGSIIVIDGGQTRS